MGKKLDKNRRKRPKINKKGSGVGVEIKNKREKIKENVGK